MKHIQPAIQAILFDFHKVLSNDRFYADLAITHPDIFQAIQDKVFVAANQPLLYAWMRGEIDYHAFHTHIGHQYAIDEAILNTSLPNSVRSIRLNQELFTFAKQERKIGIKTAIVTDNMDVFTDIYVPHTHLDRYFDAIISSSVYKQLKGDHNGELLLKAAAMLNTPITLTLLIDDGEKIGEIMKNLGGQFYLYKEYDTQLPHFLEWYRNYSKSPSI